MPIFFIHGRSQENQIKDKLHEKWRNSLFISGADRAGVKLPESVQTFFPYYGNSLATHPKGNTSNQEKFRSAKELNSQKVQSELTSELAEIIRVRANASGFITDAPQLRMSGQDTLRAPSNHPASLQESTRSLASLLNFVEGIAPTVSSIAVLTLQDVAQYLTDQQVKKAVHSIIHREFESCAKAASVNNEPIVVIAHSLGSVVAIEFLAEYAQTPIELMITLGSPLGLAGIYRRLIASPVFPQSVKRWVNASDPRDIIATVPALGRHSVFSKMYKSDQNARCDVLNLIDVVNTTDNHHSITGYLDEPAIARLVYEVLFADRN
jgi:hypothetical protein